MRGKIEQDGVYTTILTLPEREQRLGAPFVLVCRTPDGDRKASTFHYIGDSERDHQQFAAMLVELHQGCEARGMKLVLAEPPECMTTLLQLTGLDALFNVQIGSASS